MNMGRSASNETCNTFGTNPHLMMLLNASNQELPNNLVVPNYASLNALNEANTDDILNFYRIAPAADEPALTLEQKKLRLHRFFLTGSLV